MSTSAKIQFSQKQANEAIQMHIAMLVHNRLENGGYFTQAVVDRIEVEKYFNDLKAVGLLAEDVTLGRMWAYIAPKQGMFIKAGVLDHTLTAMDIETVLQHLTLSVIKHQGPFADVDSEYRLQAQGLKCSTLEEIRGAGPERGLMLEMKDGSRFKITVERFT